MGGLGATANVAYAFAMAKEMCLMNGYSIVKVLERTIEFTYSSGVCSSVSEFVFPPNALF